MLFSVCFVVLVVVGVIVLLCRLFVWLLLFLLFDMLILLVFCYCGCCCVGVGLVGFLLFCVRGVRVVLLCIDVVGVLLQPCLGLLYTYSCS